MKNIFSENCRQIVGQRLEYFRFCHVINYLLTGLLVPYREILSPRFFMHGPRKLCPYFKTSGLVFHGTALAPIRLINSNSFFLYELFCRAKTLKFNIPYDKIYR